MNAGFTWKKVRLMKFEKKNSSKNLSKSCQLFISKDIFNFFIIFVHFNFLIYI